LVRNQQTLCHNGLNKETRRYEVDKWGGKYLRAPDIYWKILEKLGDKLTPLEDIADVHRGVTTGANNFFFVDKNDINHWGIESKYLHPVLKSPKECQKAVLYNINQSFWLFVCHEDRKSLQGKRALDYIKYGEAKGYHLRPTCSSRHLWYDLGTQEIPDAIWFKSFNERYFYPINLSGFIFSDRFYVIKFHEEYSESILFAALNNSFVALSTELMGRVNLGEGALDNMVYEAANNLVVSPSSIADDLPIIDREILILSDELTLSDRLEFEYKLFTSIGLSHSDIDELHNSLLNLVQNRISKSESI
jgi:hypothetical protein